MIELVAYFDFYYLVFYKDNIKFIEVGLTHNVHVIEISKMIWYWSGNC